MGRTRRDGSGHHSSDKSEHAFHSLPRMFSDLLNELRTANKVTLYADVQMKPVAAEEHHTLVQALFGGAVSPEEFARRQEMALIKSR